ARVLETAEIVIEIREPRMIGPETPLDDTDASRVRDSGFIEAACIFAGNTELVERVRQFERVRTIVSSGNGGGVTQHRHCLPVLSSRSKAASARRQLGC